VPEGFKAVIVPNPDPLLRDDYRFVSISPKRKLNNQQLLQGSQLERAAAPQ
jgi:hypothetical protein